MKLVGDIEIGYPRLSEKLFSVAWSSHRHLFFKFQYHKRNILTSYYQKQFKFQILFIKKFLLSQIIPQRPLQPEYLQSRILLLIQY